jgi:lipoprotein-anchoring transpeptidase ErfK/SrfK
MDVQARLVRSALAALGAFVVMAAPAAAQSPVPTPTPPAPPPPPAVGQLSVATTTPYLDGKRVVALRGDKVTITGRLTPFVAGQTATVRVKLGRKTLVRRRVAIAPAPDGSGIFAVRTHLRRTGTVRIDAIHRGTPQLAAAEAKAVRVLVVRPAAGYASRGAVVRMLQRGLRALRYEARVTGVYDAATGRAVLAWRKVNRRARIETADSGVVRAVLAGKGGWKVRHPRAGRHVEADISLQALALIDGDRVVAVFPTSSGAPATPTILGRYRFYLKTPGTNAKGLVDSNYFIGGYAIHGYYTVPAFNASHGCLRVPIPDARRIYNWIRVGNLIFVEP